MTAPALRPAEAVPTAGDVEWGVANINADDVWDQYGVRGEGIVVANIDTGVQFDHPALVEQYRGTRRDGSFDHDYNWFDASGACGPAPCDGNGHGTHTMGTMAGSDGADNQIGVAPGVTWIAANGCCPSDAALVASGQWMLAPTDLDGQNPDPARRPHIVNNSWGTEGPSNEPMLDDVARAWAASGIFGVWANGNSGPRLPHQRIAGQPGAQLLGRRLRLRRQHRVVLQPRRRPGRGDQAQHLRARCRRAPPRSPVTATTSSTAPRWPRLTSPEPSPCSGRRPRPSSATSTPRGPCSTPRQSTVATTSAVAPPTTTTSTARVSSTCSG
ncbi:S8 family serine peptidase [Nocardioides sp. TF02-7]|nr:S8 family serine peptidase [Nocardioides sp. TF02-7]UMG92873.1 S8 family serine peptidase [Nocardioides sp. TF02-7]